MRAQGRPGRDIDGFRLDERMHRGTMSSLWLAASTARPTAPAEPLVMKFPSLAEGEDVSAIVGFEVEQMILPRLSRPARAALRGGRRFLAHALSSSWSASTGESLRRIDSSARRCRSTRSPISARASPAALQDLHRQNVHPSRPQARQHHARRDGDGRVPRFRPLAPRRAAGPAGRGIRRADGHGPLYRARADPRRPQRAAQRHLSRSGSCCTSSRRATGPSAIPQPQGRHDAPVLARSAAAARAQPETARTGCRRSSCAAWRSTRTSRFATAAQLAFALQNPDQMRLTERGRAREAGRLDGPCSAAG